MRVFATILCLLLTAATTVAQKIVRVAAEGKSIGAATAAARLEYRARAASLAKHDVVGHFALAQWCDKKQLTRCARWELHEVLREMPDHVGARRRLGQVYHDGKWLPEVIAMRAKGFVRFDGKWLRKYDAERARHERHRVLALQHQANLLFARLADPSARTRDAAHRELEALSRAEEWPELGKLARRKAAEYATDWRRRPGSHTAYTGILTINLTHSQLLGLNPFTTSLGVGTPVRLHLPQMKTISIGTTVAVPLGRGR